jgi:hypothetical protein
MSLKVFMYSKMHVKAGGGMYCTVTDGIFLCQQDEDMELRFAAGICSKCIYDQLLFMVESTFRIRIVCNGGIHVLLGN